MMDTMRRAAKSWVAKLLIGLLAVSFGVWGIADVFRAGSTDTLAMVGDQQISPQQYQREFQQRLQEISRRNNKGVTPEEARAFGLDRIVLQDLMHNAALDHETATLNLGVSNGYILQELQSSPAFQNAAGKFDPESLKQMIAREGMSEQVFFDTERQRLLRQSLVATAGGDVPVNAGLLEALYRFQNEQRDARFFIVTTADSEVPAPTDEEVKKEYETNPGAYTAPEYRAVAVMKVEPADIAAKITLSDQDIAAGYEKYKSEFFTPERRSFLQLSFPTLEAAQAAKQKLASGTDFMALAQELGSGEKDVTFTDQTRNDLIDPVIAEAVFTLPEGQVSDPVKGQLATVLIKTVKVTPEHQSTLDEVKAQLTARLQLERANEEIQSVYDAVEDARAAQTKFEEIAASAGIPFQLVPAVDAQGMGKDGKPAAVAHADEVVKAAFASDVGVENDAISVENGYVWYEVREVIPSAIKPFDSVKDQARAAVVAAKARAMSEDKAKKLVERARSGVKFDELATEANAKLETARGLRRGSQTASFGPAAVAALFAVPENGFAYALEPDGRSARVMQSEPVLLPAFEPNSPEAKQIATELKDKVAEDMITAYLLALQDEAGVKVNDAAWQAISGQQTN